MSSSTVYLYSQNDPVIESSSNLTFAPYNLAYPHLLEHFADANLDSDKNRWDLVFDFTGTNADGKKEEHFKMLPPEEFAIVTKTVEGFEVEPTSI